MDPRFRFLQEAGRLRDVERSVHDASRRENSAEHSWHVALFVLAFASRFPGADLGRMLSLAVVHDLCEVYAGDTCLFDEEGREGKAEREAAATKRLLALLPDEERSRFAALVDEYEAGASREARIVKGMDELQPILYNVALGGESWQRYGITRAVLDEKKRATMEREPELLRLYEELLAEAERRGLLCTGGDSNPRPSA